LAWVILTVAIIATLIAAAAPTLATMDERARAVSTANELKAIATGFVLFGPLVGAYPGNVSDLTNTLTLASWNTCHLAMSASNVANWPTNAPYVPFYTAASGNWTEMGRIRDSVPVRPNPAARTPIFVEIPGASAADAAMLELVVDGATGDTVTFAAPVNDTTTIRYRVVSTGVVVNNRC